jgi:hypothetical protein
MPGINYLRSQERWGFWACFIETNESMICLHYSMLSRLAFVQRLDAQQAGHFFRDFGELERLPGAAEADVTQDEMDAVLSHSPPWL